MLDSISIKNFKAIGDNELIINNLNVVNYLVGANGSGKSSIMELLYVEINIRNGILEMFKKSEIKLENPPQKLRYLVHNNNIIKPGKFQ